MKELSKEEEELLLKDLSTRVIYHTICSIYREDDFKIGWRDAELTGCFFGDYSYEFYFDYCSSVDNILNIKPYLRPMSSMTEEEKKEYNDIVKNTIDFYDCPKSDSVCFLSVVIDWLIKNHFDYRGLIEKNLALDCTGLHIYD